MPAFLAPGERELTRQSQKHDGITGDTGAREAGEARGRKRQQMLHSGALGTGFNEGNRKLHKNQCSLLRRLALTTAPHQSAGEVPERGEADDKEGRGCRGD